MNSVWKSKNRFFIYVIFILLVFSLLAVFLVGAVEYWRYYDDNNAFKRAKDTAEIAFWSILFLFIPVFFLIRSLYASGKKNIVNMQDMAQKFQEDNRLIKEQLYTDFNNELACKYILDSDFITLQTANVIILEIDDYDKIASHYSTDFNKTMLNQISVEFKKIALEYNFEAYRFSNTKFAMLSYSPKINKIDMKQISNHLCSVFKGYYIAHNYEYLYLCCTIGICLQSKNALNKALIALSIAKDRDLDFLFYDENFGLNNQIKQNKEKYKLIEEAIQVKTIIKPYFQPIFDINEKICKYEALARIVTQQGIVILPGIFIDYTKHIKRYVEFSKELIEKIILTIQQKPNIVVSINMSISDMIDSPLSLFLIDKIQTHNIGENIVIEILENENIKANDELKVKTFIAKLRSYGVKIAIDDFGSGFSNFQLILQVIPDYLKIDGSIIKELAYDDEKAENIVRAIVSFAKSLKIRTVAEFVSSRTIYENCRKLGVDEFQGFYFGEPSEKPVDLD